MVSKKSGEHMANSLNKNDSLPSLQKAIVAYMAENEPKTIRQISIALSKDYSATHTAFKSLEKKKLVAKTTVKRYREQDFDCSWLTDEGMILAMIDGADVNRLLELTKIIYPDVEVAHIFLEVIQLLGVDTLRVTYGYAKGKGKLEFAEVLQITLAGALSAVEIDTGKKVAKVLKKYPTYYAALKSVVEEMIRTLNQLIED